MKFFAALVLILSLAGIGILGFTLLNHSMMHGSNGGCVTSAIDRTTCPASLIDMTLHHLSALQRLMTTVPPPISTMLLLIASLFSLGLALLSRFPIFSPQRTLSTKRHEDTFFAPQEQQRVRWLALLENSPASI